MSHFPFFQNYYGINQATFSHFVCQRSQTRFSELLTEARVEGYYCRSKGVFEIYRRMESWLKQPLQERIAAYNQWLEERGHASKKKGFIRKSSLALALKDGAEMENIASSVSTKSNSSPEAGSTPLTTKAIDSKPNSKTVTTIYVNEKGEYIHMTTAPANEVNSTTDAASTKENTSPNADGPSTGEKEVSNAESANGNDGEDDDDEEEYADDVVVLEK